MAEMSDVNEKATVDDMLVRAVRTKHKLDRMIEVLSMRRAAEASSATVVINPLDDILSELQLLASSVIVGELKDAAVRPALARFARRFEELDAALSGGLHLPTEWQKRRRR
ncbi:MAG: hypothetical protein ACREIS_05570 [Nitrospiraceae bacterium]